MVVPREGHEEVGEAGGVAGCTRAECNDGLRLAADKTAAILARAAEVTRRFQCLVVSSLYRYAMSSWLWGLLHRPVDFLANSRHARGQARWGPLCAAG